MENNSGSSPLNWKKSNGEQHSKRRPLKIIDNIKQPQITQQNVRVQPKASKRNKNNMVSSTQNRKPVQVLITSILCRYKLCNKICQLDNL